MAKPLHAISAIHHIHQGECGGGGGLRIKHSSAVRSKTKRPPSVFYFRWVKDGWHSYIHTHRVFGDIGDMQVKRTTSQAVDLNT